MAELIPKTAKIWLYLIRFFAAALLLGVLFLLWIIIGTIVRLDAGAPTELQLLLLFLKNRFFN